LGALIWPFSEKKVCALCNYSFEFENGMYSVILYCTNARLIESRMCSTRCVPRYDPSVKVSFGGDRRAIAEASVPNDCLH
jgi:hypothetical protein